MLAPLAAIDGQNRRIETFDFKALASAFDAAGQVNGWALTEALLDAHLAGSDVEALGGEMAFQYGLMRGQLNSLDAGAINTMLGNEAFGEEAQSVSPRSNIPGTGPIARLFGGLHLS
jgi:hypothetical protein